MKRRILSIICFLVLGGLTVFAFTASRSPTSKETDDRVVKKTALGKGLTRAPSGAVGSPAPDWGVDTWFNLPGGKEKATLDDFKGKVVYILGFQTWCPGCHRIGFPTLKKVMDHYENNDDVQFMAVQTTFEGFSTNDLAGAKKTAERYNLDIPVGHSGSRGEPSKFMRRYRTRGTPWVIIIDRRGIVRYSDFHIKKTKAVNLIDRLLETKGDQL